jgi:hypothetical protein
VQQVANTTQTGIGILILTSPSHSFFQWNVFLGGYSAYPATLRGRSIGTAVGNYTRRCTKLQRPVFITNNRVLAYASKRKDLLHNPGHWFLRPILADFLITTASMMHSISKIGRSANTVTDNLAKKAR